MHNRPENFDVWSLSYRCNNTYCRDDVIDSYGDGRANSTISNYQFEVEPIYGVNYGVDVTLFFGVDGTRTVTTDKKQSRTAANSLFL